MCQRWTEGGINSGLTLFFPNYVQPDSLARPPLQSFPFGFFPVSLLRSLYICSSQHTQLVQIRQMLWRFLSARIRLVRSARARCALSNLSDVMKAGVSNAARWGKMWRLYAIDKLQLSSSEESKRDARGIGSAHMKANALIHHILLTFWYQEIRYCRVYNSSSNLNFTLFCKCHYNRCRLKYRTNTRNAMA